MNPNFEKRTPHSMRKIIYTAAAILGISFGYIEASFATNAGSCQIAGSQISAQIRVYLNGTDVEAAYELSRPVQCFQLSPAGEVRKLSWKLEDSNVALSADGNSLNFFKPTKKFKVILTTSLADGQIDRVYTPVLKFGDGKAIAVFSEYLMPAMANAKAVLTFAGYYPLSRRISIQTHKINASAPSTYIVLGNPKLVRVGKTTIVIDTANPGWLNQAVISDINGGIESLNQIARLPQSLTYLITSTDQKGARAAWRGDVLTNLVRLNFIGANWEKSDPAKAKEVLGFVLHELFHTVNSNVANESVGVVTLLEGGAEAASGALQLRMGFISEAELWAKADAAMARCLQVNGATLSEKEKSNGRIVPYACGEAIQHLAVSSLGKNLDILEIWKVLLTRQNRKKYDWDDFFKVLRELADVSSIESVNLLDNLVHSRITWAEALLAFEKQGNLRRLTLEELHTPIPSEYFSKKVLLQILDTTCKGRRGITQFNATYELDAPHDSCDLLLDKFKVVQLNGHSLKLEGYDAYVEQIRRCRAKQPTDLLNDLGEHKKFECLEAPKDVDPIFSFKPAVIPTSINGY